MNNRTLLAMILSFLIVWGWYTIFPPPEPVPPEDAVVEDAGPAGDPAVASASTPDDEAPPPAAPVDDVPIETVPFAGCTAQGEVTTRDGALRDVVLVDLEEAYAIEALYSWALDGFEGPWRPYGEDPGPTVLLSSAAHGLVAGAGAVDGRGPRVALVERGPERVVTRGVTADGVEITRTLRPADDGAGPCEFALDVTWRHTGDRPWTGGLWVGLHDILPEESTRYAPARRPVASVDGGVVVQDDLGDLEAPVLSEGAPGWFGLADNYSGLFVLLPEGSGGEVWFGPQPGDDARDRHGVAHVLRPTLEPGASLTQSYRVFAGPKRRDLLGEVRPDLADAVQLGWLSFLALPLLWLLKFIHGFVGNWGWAIIGLTALVKLLFFPLTQASFKSTQAMQLLKPQMDEIREQFGKDPEEMNRRMLALYRDAKVNPFGGCLPMLVQMPVWFALYGVLLSSEELYHAEFFYLKDLSAVDPYLALPIIVIGLMLIQQQMMPTANLEPAQARMMKLMPLMFGFFFFSFPAGLVLYIFVNMLLSIAQQWYIKRTFTGLDPTPAAPGA